MPALLTPGSLDPSFGVEGKVRTNITCPGFSPTRALDGLNVDLAIEADGKIVVAGMCYFEHSHSPDDYRGITARYNSDGSLDPTFSGDGLLGTIPANAVAIQPDGKIIVVGFSPSSSTFTLAVQRLLPDGRFDPTFGGDGRVDGFGQDGVDVELQSDGKIIIATGSNIVRLNSDGTLNLAFGSRSNDIALEPDGDVITLGDSGQGPAVRRYKSDGQLDPTFGDNGTAKTPPFTMSGSEIIVQPDGKTVVAGYTPDSCYDCRDPQFALARFTRDGDLDATFGTNGIVVTDMDAQATASMANAVRIQSDGKIVAAGSRSQSPSGDRNDPQDFALARYTETGELDLSFGDNGTVRTDFGAANDHALALELLCDGRIVAAGSSEFSLARYLGDQRLTVTGADAGGGPAVRVFNSEGAECSRFHAYDRSFTGGVRVATGEVNGDGVLDIITAPGKGGSPTVKVFHAYTSALLNTFSAYGTFNGGVFVAVGDTNGDGRDEIITGADAGGGPAVRVFSGLGTEFLRFHAYETTFHGGARVAAGDINGDGKDEIITAPGAGRSSNIRVFSGTTGSLLRSFTAYGSFTGGVYVAAGDTNGDGRDDIITGAGAGGSPLVKIFNSANPSSAPRSFLAYASSFTGGVRVAAADVNGDGKADIITGPGRRGKPLVRLFDGVTFASIDHFFAYDETFTGGVFVAG